MEPNFRDDKARSIQWAQTILANKPDAVIIDTETTGLGDADQIVQIGIIDMAGNVLLDALVKPTIAIPPGATAVHHIGAEAVIHALAWPTLYPAVDRLLRGAYVITYNADYDRRMIVQTCQAHTLPEIQANVWDCAMRAYASFWGSWNDYRMSYAWQKLTDACKQQNIPVVGAHGAVGDCQMTLALIHKMAETRIEAEESSPNIFEDGADQWAIDPDEGDRQRKGENA